MIYYGDPTKTIEQQFSLEYEPEDLPWWEQQKKMENRPIWGQYYEDLFPLKDYKNWYDRPIYCWLPMCLSGKTPIEDIYEVTEWLKENIDNVWEGPIGYLGVWKFLFTEESDCMAFKLLTA